MPTTDDVMHKLEEARRNKQRRQFSLIALWASTAAALVGGIATLALIQTPISHESQEPLRPAVNIDHRPSLPSPPPVNAPRTHTPVGSTPSADVMMLIERFRVVEQRELALEDAIGASPEKALSVPLLQRELDDLKADEARSEAATKDSIDRVYDIMKWFIGAILLSVLGLVVSNILRPREKP